MCLCILCVYILVCPQYRYLICIYNLISVNLIMGMFNELIDCIYLC